MRRICADTGFLGQPIDPIFEDRELFADYVTGYYTRFEPDAMLVCELRGEVKGYLMGCRRPLIKQAYQAVANLSFSWLALVGVDQWALALAITAENFTSAIGTVIFVAYLSALCQNPLHTATQYALLTALAAVGRTYLSSGAGYIAKASGWPLFFIICVVVAVPSLILLAYLQRRGHFAALETPRVVDNEAR